MKLRNMVAPVVFGALSLAVANANAAAIDNNATNGGIVITNNATLSYEVNNAPQTAVKAFNNLLVDVKVDFDAGLITNALNTSSTLYNLDSAAADSGLQYYLVGDFELTNTSNTDTFFKFTAENTASGTDVDGTGTGAVDNNDATAFVIYIENETGPNSTQLTTGDTKYVADSEVKLDKDETKRIYVAALQSSIQGVDKDVFGTKLTATATKVTRQVAAIAGDNSVTYTERNVALPGHNAAGTGSDSDLEFVYADTSNNAVEAIDGGLIVSFPNLGDGNGGGGNDSSGNFTKTSTVISDPINGATASAKAIPGAIVEYTITIKNTGSVAADSVVISDLVPTSTTFQTGTIKWTEHGGSETTLTDAGSDDAGDHDVTEAGKVTVNIGTLGANETDTIKFRVEIK